MRMSLVWNFVIVKIVLVLVDDFYEGRRGSKLPTSGPFEMLFCVDDLFRENVGRKMYELLSDKKKVYF